MHRIINPQVSYFSDVMQAASARIQFDAHPQNHRDARGKDDDLSEVKLIFYPQCEYSTRQSVVLKFEKSPSYSQRPKVLHFYWDKGRYGLLDPGNPREEESDFQPTLNTTLTTPLGIHLYEQLCSYESIPDLSLEYMVRLLLLNLVKLYDQYQVLEAHGGGLIPRQVVMVHDLIVDHQDTFFPVKALADYLGLSFYHFSRMFKKSTGFSPYQYMLKLKMQKALELILTSSESVIQVGLATGFENPGHFSKVFKKFHGATPSQIRKDQSVCPNI